MPPPGLRADPAVSAAGAAGPRRELLFQVLLFSAGALAVLALPRLPPLAWLAGACVPALIPWLPMPKNAGAPPGFGARLAQLRKAAGYTQTELAAALGTTQRVIAYYEGETQHPPTTLLPKMAEVLGVTADELLGLKAPRKSKAPDTRLQRRLQQIERMPAREKRHILHMLDTFIEHARLKERADA